MAHSHPQSKNGFNFHKQAFRDALCLRFGWTPTRLAPHCRCGHPFSVSHVFSCPNGAMCSIRRNTIRDITAQLLTEVYPNICVEPTLQPLTGETFPLRSTNIEEGARSTSRPKISGTKANDQPSLISESTPMHQRIVHPPPMLATEGMNERRGEHMNSVSLKWSMVPLLLWSCPQVEVGVRLPWLLSRDLQVSFLRNTTNHRPALPTSSDVRSPSA